MTRFDRYLLGQLLMSFGFFALVLVGVYWVNRSVSLVGSLMSDGQTARVFLEFTFLTLPGVTRLVLPIAAFVAAVHVIHRMITESEFVVMQATGFSPFRLARPVVVFGLVVALMLSALLHWLVPASRAEIVERRAEIAENITARMLTEGAFVHPAPGVTLYVRRISPEGVFRDLFLSDARAGGPRTVYTAREALLVRTEAGPQLVMVDGAAQSLREPQQRLTVTTFDTLTYDVAALIGPRGALERRLPELSSVAILRMDADALAAVGVTPRDAAVELHGRVAQPLMAMTAGLVGFAALILGAFSRLGVWRQVLGGILAVIAVHFLDTTASGAVSRGAAAWPLLYLAPAVALAGSLAVMWLAGRPGRRPRPGGGDGGASLARGQPA